MTWDYVAGFFDGEGSATILTRRLCLSMSNTDLAALEAIRDFIGCGSIRQLTLRNRPAHHKPCFILEVGRVADLARVVPELLPRSIVKRSVLETMSARLAAGVRTRARTFGAVKAAGVDTIKRWYEDDGLTLNEIADRLGTAQSTVIYFMEQQGIARRLPGPRPRVALA